MKPIIISFVFLAIAGGIFSCSKTSSPTPPAGYWTFNGATDTAVTAVATTVSGNLSATTSTTANPNEALTFNFSSYPTASGNYPVVANGSSSASGNYVGVALTYGTTNYWSTGNDHVSANVTVSASGKVTVALTSVEVRAVTVATPDSGAVTNITVTQQ